MLQNIFTYFSEGKLRYLAFWALLFVFSALQSSYLYSSNIEFVTVYSIRVTLQILIAYCILEQLIPKVLYKGKTYLFAFSIFTLLLVSYVFCTAVSKYYLEVVYPATYVNYLKRFSDLSWYGRMTNFSEIISKSLYILYPTFLISALKFYSEKQKLLKLNEQKKTAELTALKNQLNPHFLFNTLNNLYALALKKSDDTTKVIEKLSKILDYILYRCNDDYVLLEKEIELIENYLSLEKIRYGNRVKIAFSKHVTGKEKIAPLLLLTFIENAFKHGVSEEINQANIQINITKNNNELEFIVENTKPQGIKPKEDKESIGLKNVKKQLELLYPKAYHLNIKNTKTSFLANLKLSII